MAPETGQAMRKKLDSTRERVTPVAARLMEAWGEIVPSAAEDTLGINLMVGRLEAKIVVLEMALQDVPETSLMIRTEREDGTLGLVIIDQVALAAFLEVQTSGHVRRSEVPVRLPTATDAMIISDLLEPWMKSTDVELEIFKGFDEYLGYRPTVLVPDARTALMNMLEGMYRQTELTLDFEEGRRVGTLSLLYPLTETVRPKVPDDKSLGEELAEAIMEAPVAIEAVLYTTQRGLGEIADFKEGDVIAVPVSALAELSLKAVDGASLGRARLGQLSGQRAIRIQVGVEEEEEHGFNPAKALGAGAAMGLPEPPPAPSFPSLSDVGGLLDLPDLPPMSDDTAGEVLPSPPPSLDNLPAPPPPLDDLPPPPPPLSERLEDAPNLDGLPELPPLID